MDAITLTLSFVVQMVIEISIFVLRAYERSVHLCVFSNLLTLEENEEVLEGISVFCPYFCFNCLRALCMTQMRATDKRPSMRTMMYLCLNIVAFFKLFLAISVSRKLT